MQLLPEPNTPFPIEAKCALPELRGLPKQSQRGTPDRIPYPSQARNTTVSVLMLKWADDDLGITSELAQLRDVFDQSYIFDTEIWDIPSQNPDRELTYQIYSWRDRYCKPSPTEGQQLPLLILYYGGHAEENLKNTCRWRR